MIECADYRKKVEIFQRSCVITMVGMFWSSFFICYVIFIQEWHVLKHNSFQKTPRLMKERMNKTLLSCVPQFILDVRHYKNKHRRNVLCNFKIHCAQNSNLISHGSSLDETKWNRTRLGIIANCGRHEQWQFCICLKKVRKNIGIILWAHVSHAFFLCMFWSLMRCN